MNWRGALLFSRRRAAQGWQRVRSAALPSAEAALAAALAWTFAHAVLDHPAPFFAPVAAWVCLGFSRLRDIRAVAELAAGVTIGVGLGDLLVHIIGSGPVQIGSVLLVAALAARFIDRGRLLTLQAGIQSVIVVALPVGAGVNPVGRWTDALTGGVIALLVTVAVPHSLRRPLREAAFRGLAELTDVLELTARALAAEDRRLSAAAVIRARASQAVLDEWFSVARSATQLVKISPRRWSDSAEVGRLATTSVYIDRAMRNARVIARRADGMLLDTVGSSAAAHRMRDLAAATDQLAAATRTMADACRRGEPPTAAQGAVRAATAPLTAELAGAAWQPRTYVLLLRSLAVDLLEACGLRRQDARSALPPIDDLNAAA